MWNSQICVCLKTRSIRIHYKLNKKVRQRREDLGPKKLKEGSCHQLRMWRCPSDVVVIVTFDKIGTRLMDKEVSLERKISRQLETKLSVFRVGAWKHEALSLQWEIVFCCCWWVRLLVFCPISWGSVKQWHVSVLRLRLIQEPWGNGSHRWSQRDVVTHHLENVCL